MHVRQFQREFGKLNARLKPGEKVTVTKLGKTQGIYQRTGAGDVATKKRLRQVLRESRDAILNAPYSAKEGEALGKKLDAGLS